MKKLELNATYNEAKEAAIKLGIHYVGKKREVVIELVNKEIDKLDKKENKSHTLEDYGLEEGQIVKISGFEVGDKKILEGRQVCITRTSRRKGYIKGRLINEETGELQKTEIAITADIIIQEGEKEVI